MIDPTHLQIIISATKIIIGMGVIVIALGLIENILKIFIKKGK